MPYLTTFGLQGEFWTIPWSNSAGDFPVFGFARPE